MFSTAKWVRSTLRLERTVHDALVVIVRRKESSLNAEINVAIREYVVSHDTPPKKRRSGTRS